MLIVNPKEMIKDRKMSKEITFKEKLHPQTITTFTTTSTLIGTPVVTTMQKLMQSLSLNMFTAQTSCWCQMIWVKSYRNC